MKLTILTSIILLTSTSFSLILKHHSLTEKIQKKTNKFEDLIDNIIEKKFHSNSLINKASKNALISDGSPVERGLMQESFTPDSLLNNQKPHKIKKAMASKNIFFRFC